MKKRIHLLHLPISIVLLMFSSKTMAQQPLSLHEALEIGVNNYEIIKSKEQAVEAAKKEYQSSRTLYLPEIMLSAQQYYGTANLLHGPQYGFGESITSMGAPQEAQNWDAAFSSLYGLNLNWNVFSFGARKNRVVVSQKQTDLAVASWEQELFEHQIKIASHYLNLIAIEEIIAVQEQNVERSEVLVSTVKSVVESGIRPSVELATAQAELAAAHIALLKAQDRKSFMLKELIVSMGVDYQNYTIDKSLITRAPISHSIADDILNHPALRTQDRAIDISKTTQKAIKAEGLPKLNIVGSLAARGSGFNYNYAQDQSNFSPAYLEGIAIQRGNYLVGLNLSWNITSLLRNNRTSLAQKHKTASLNEQRASANRALNESFRHATEKMSLAQLQYQAVLNQVDAATQSYQQYGGLYKSGLAVVDDLIQATYNLARAESERAVIQVNVWQAYLMQIASSGNIEEFIHQIK